MVSRHNCKHIFTASKQRKLNILVFPGTSRSHNGSSPVRQLSTEVSHTTFDRSCDILLIGSHEGSDMEH